MNYSVVIPVFNAADTIIGTLQSCLQQTLQPLEIILVDDCSTDEGLLIVQREFGDQIKIIRQQQNQGPSAARNAGWNAAQGDYVAFLDSDDRWHPRKMELCAIAFQMQPHIDLLWHPYQVEALPPYQQESAVNSDLKPTKLLPLLIRNPVSSSAIVFRRSLPLRFDAAMRYCEDYLIAVQATYMYRVVQVSFILAQIGRPVLAAGGLSSNLSKMRQGERRTYGALTQLNPLFYIVYPLLLTWATVKHLRALFKSRFGKTN